MLVRSLDDKLERQPKDLFIASDPSFGDVDLANDDVMFNVLTSETVHKRKEDGILWRGPKEKSDSLLHLFLNGLCPSKGIVADLTTGTGKSFFINPNYHTTS